MTFVPFFTNSQLQYLKLYERERRRAFSSPTLLIVEDQEFSRKLLEGMLLRHYRCYSAATAEEAIALYAEHIPSILFLDIELPDLSGHELAAFIKKHDPDSFIVMVTANHYEKDVELARQNHVQGFIAKPYSQQKIINAIEKFQSDRQLRYRKKR